MAVKIFQKKPLSIATKYILMTLFIWFFLQAGLGLFNLKGPAFSWAYVGIAMGLLCLITLGETLYSLRLTLAAVLLSVFVFWRLDRIANSLVLVLNGWIDNYNNYFQAELTYYYTIDVTVSPEFLIFVTWILGMLLMITYGRRGWLWSGGLLALALPVIGMSVGITPPWQYVGAMLLCLPVMRMVDDSLELGPQLKAMGLMTLVAGGLAALAYLLLIPRSEQILDHTDGVKTAIHDQLSEWNQQALDNGISLINPQDPPEGIDYDLPVGFNHGELSTAQEYHRVTSVQLTLHVDERPETTMYLRGYHGGMYENGQWSEDDDVQSDGGLQLTHYMESTGQNGLDLMSIYSHTSGDSRIYIPYGETFIDGNIWYYSNVYSAMQTLNGYSTSMYQEPLHVSDYYRALGNSVQTQWLQAFDYTNTGDIMNLIGEVRRGLAAQAEYDLRPGPVPEGRDPVDYFLNTNQKGFCMHFATAGTLILRYNGIPARYTEGYVVEPSLFEPSENGGYEAQVTANMAHAWSEVYINDVGWVVAEMTPGYSSETDPSQTETGETQASETEEITENPQETQSSESAGPEETQSDSPETNEAGEVIEDPASMIEAQEARELPLSAKILMGIALGFSAVFIGLNGYKKIRYARVHTADINLNIQRLYDRACRRPYNSKALKELRDLAHEAAFSGQVMTMDKQRRAEQLYENIVKKDSKA